MWSVVKEMKPVCEPHACRGCTLHAPTLHLLLYIYFSDFNRAAAPFPPPLPPLGFSPLPPSSIVTYSNNTHSPRRPSNSSRSLHKHASRHRHPQQLHHCWQRTKHTGPKLQPVPIRLHLLPPLPPAAVVPGAQQVLWRGLGRGKEKRGMKERAKQGHSFRVCR